MNRRKGERREEEEKKEEEEEKETESKTNCIILYFLWKKPCGLWIYNMLT